MLPRQLSRPLSGSLSDFILRRLTHVFTISDFIYDLSLGIDICCSIVSYTLRNETCLTKYEIYLDRRQAIRDAG